MGVIVQNLKLSKENCGIHIPPLMISRMSRGGKTTLLLLLFQQLRQEPNIHPIFISFNRTATYLTQKQAILHLIAVQLTDPSEINCRNIICDENALDFRLGNEPVVLLIDELNSLASPLDEEAGAMLKTLFLDKQNRYLVFSTHVPMLLDPLKSRGTMRDCVELRYHPTSEFPLLQNMLSEFCNLTTAEAMMYGGVPSLIYSVKFPLPFSPFRYYDRFKNELTFDESHFRDFLLSVMDGTYPETIRFYARFGMVSKGTPTEGHLIHWPLCYIILLLESFSPALPEFQSALRGIFQSYQLLCGKDKEWESILNIAILIRCILSKFDSYYSPFSLFQRPISNFRFLCLKDEVITLEAAKRVIDTSLKALATSQKPAVLLAIPTSSSFEGVDGIIVHCRSHDTIEYHGYQAKVGEVNGILPDWMSNCFLLRARPKDPAKDVGGNYFSKSSTYSLLGKSLSPLCSAMLSALYPQPSQSNCVE